MSVQKALAGVESIAIDTAPFIYYIEEHKRYLRAVDPAFNNKPYTPTPGPEFYLRLWGLKLLQLLSRGHT